MTAEVSRSGRATWNYATTLLFTAVTMVTGLAVTPTLVRLLGQERFGVARVIAEYAGWLTLLDLGLGGALAPLLARSLAGGDPSRTRDTLAAGLRLYGRVALITLAIGLAATPLIPGLIRSGPSLAGELRWAWVLTILGMTSIAFMPFRALLDAGQRGYLYNLICTYQAIAVAVLSLLLARAGLGLVGQSLALAVGAWTSMGLLTAASLGRSAGVAAAVFRRADREAAESLRRLSGPNLIMNISGRISLMTDAIIVAMILPDVALVTTLFVTQRLAQLAKGQLDGIASATWAGLIDLHNRGLHDVFRDRLVELTRLIAILAAAGLAPILAFNGRFVALWVGPGLDGGRAIVAVAAANALLGALVALWGWCLNGTGRIALMVVPSIVGGVVNVVASVLLTIALGVIGPILGTLISYVTVYLWYYPLLIHRHLGVPAADLARAASAPAALGVLYAVVLGRLVPASVPMGWAGLALTMSASSLAFLGLALAFLVRPDDRSRWRRRLASMMPRPRLKPQDIAP